MATPKTRIPKVVRRDVESALACWRDYLAAIGNEAGASSVKDVAFVLGLSIPLDGLTRRYWNPALAALVKNRREHGSR